MFTFQDVYFLFSSFFYDLTVFRLSSAQWPCFFPCLAFFCFLKLFSWSVYLPGFLICLCIFYAIRLLSLLARIDCTALLLEWFLPLYTFLFLCLFVFPVSEFASFFSSLYILLLSFLPRIDCTAILLGRFLPLYNLLSRFIYLSSLLICLFPPF